jgi:hypothetical protein
VALNIDAMNNKLIETWMDKHTDWTDEEKAIMINVKNKVQSDLSLFYDINKIALLEKGTIECKEHCIDVICSNGMITLNSLGGIISKETREFRKVATTFIEIYEQVYPIGTVVDLKKEAFSNIYDLSQVDKLRVVIAHRYVPVSDERYMPYIGVHYPYGPTGHVNDGVHFTLPAIERVVSMGYSDEEEEAYVFNLKNKIIADLDIHSNAFMSKEEYMSLFDKEKVTN